MGTFGHAKMYSYLDNFSRCTFPLDKSDEYLQVVAVHYIDLLKIDYVKSGATQFMIVFKFKKYVSYVYDSGKPLFCIIPNFCYLCITCHTCSISLLHNVISEPVFLSLTQIQLHDAMYTCFNKRSRVNNCQVNRSLQQ